MIEALQAHDAGLVSLCAARGAVLVAPGLQGRIFCQIRGELVHRLDVERIEHPSPMEFNNFGGNSLWPAPEGGAFAFNYPPGGGEWRVQQAVNQANYEVALRAADRVRIEKRVILLNRKGIEVDVAFRRDITLLDTHALATQLGLDVLAYTCTDEFEPLGTYRAEDVLMAPWSLEQFPGCEGVTAFAKAQNTAEAVNADFYGDPGDRITMKGQTVRFALGGEERLQIGIKVSSEPVCAGALDAQRGLLYIRRTPKQEGLYFNMADNEQEAGPFSAADVYSIFNGGALDFHEIETVAPMQVLAGAVATSRLETQTLFLRGGVDALKAYLATQEGVDLA